MSPLQLWGRGACIASDDTACQPDQYGVHIEGCNEFDVGSVVIPTSSINLTTPQITHIVSQHFPLAPSEYAGVDIYISVCETLLGMLSN